MGHGRPIKAAKLSSNFQCTWPPGRQMTSFAPDTPQVFATQSDGAEYFEALPHASMHVQQTGRACHDSLGEGGGGEVPFLNPEPCARMTYVLLKTSLMMVFILGQCSYMQMHSSLCHLKC